MKRPKTNDTFERINYLYQASHFLTATQHGKQDLSSFYAFCLKKIAMKNILKLDSSIKRTLCKKCNTLLLPGTTLKVRIRGKREKHIVHTCLKCGQMKRFMCRPDYQLWSERQETQLTQETRKDNKKTVTETKSKVSCTLNSAGNKS